MVVCIYLVIPNDNKCFLLTEKKKFPKGDRFSSFQNFNMVYGMMRRGSVKNKENKNFYCMSYIFLTSFAFLTRVSCVTHTAISSRCKTSLTGCFIIARGTDARILKRRGNIKRSVIHHKSLPQNQI